MSPVSSSTSTFPMLAHRIDVPEIHNQDWFPTSLRTHFTTILTASWTFQLPLVSADWAHHYLGYTPPCKHVAPLLADVLIRTGTTKIVDLCSGAGGPWVGLYPELCRLVPESGSLRVVLTDPYPNSPVLRSVVAQCEVAATSKSFHARGGGCVARRGGGGGGGGVGGGVQFVDRPVSADKLSDAILRGDEDDTEMVTLAKKATLGRRAGKHMVNRLQDSKRKNHVVRTVFLALHRQTAVEARQILQDTVEHGDAICVFEFTHRTIPSLLFILFVLPFIVLYLLLTHPAPRRSNYLHRLFFTFTVPILPFVLIYDGLASALREHSPEEIGEMVAQIPKGGDYQWSFKRKGVIGPFFEISCLVGMPRD